MFFFYCFLLKLHATRTGSLLPQKSADFPPSIKHIQSFFSPVSGTTCNVNLLTDEHKKGKGTQDIKTAKSWWIQKIYGVRDSFSVYEESCWSKEAESKEEVWMTLSDSRFPLTLWTTIPQRVIEHLVAHFRCFLVFGNTGLTLQTPSAAVFFCLFGFFFVYLPIARMHLACW